VSSDHISRGNHLSIRLSNLIDIRVGVVVVMAVAYEDDVSIPWGILDLPRVDIDYDSAI
jgi:hypothetical protein